MEKNFIIIAVSVFAIVLLIALVIQVRKPKCNCKGGCHCQKNNDDDEHGCNGCNGCHGCCC